MAGMSPPAVLRKQKVVLSEEEAVRILEQARKGPFYVLYLLALTTGLREGELFALQWCDVNFDNAFLSISATLTEDYERELVRSTPKTKKSQRPAALCEAAIEALLELRRVQLGLGYEGEFVFTDSTGGPLRKSNFIRRIHGPLVAAAELPKVTFHSLRHTFTSQALKDGIPMSVVSQALGHSSIRTTVDLYGHLESPEAQRGIARLGDRLYGSTLKLVGELVVSPSSETLPPKQKAHRSLKNGGPDVVEMRRLELLTPYMRSKCSTS
jgi:integrase